MSITMDTQPGAIAVADADTATPAPADRFIEEAMTEDKREGLLLAVRARWAALAVIAVLLPVVNFRTEVIYYEVLLLGFAFIGWLQLRFGRVGLSRVELVIMFFDLALMTLTILVPNPFGETDMPAAMQYRFGSFIYFFVLLAAGTLAYSWRTIVAMGTWTTGLWTAGLIVMVFLPAGDPELAAAIKTALGSNTRLFEVLDPNNVDIGMRIQEVVVFFIVAGTLALGSRRSRQLVLDQAAVVRERSNLARYFSPNVVEELSNNDEPLKTIRTQDIAVLFVDIVGFTSMAEHRAPQDVIQTLRAFHGRMEREVFRHNGTLDKYLGDGLMATFGTPSTSDRDAGNALKCVTGMIAAMEEWNAERSAQNEAEVRASFGLHFGEAVLGDVGSSRLEFAVIGNTVNVASRLEALTRELGVSMVASDALVQRARTEPGFAESDAQSLTRAEPQAVRGVAEPVPVWTAG